MFPEFWTRKILAPGETADDFREVPAAEREKLEAARAAWVRPPQAFIDQWIAAGGTWSDATGYFGLNGITDITYTEAMRIWRMSYLGIRNTWANMYGMGEGMHDAMRKQFYLRTYFPLQYAGYEAGAGIFTKTFYYNKIVEVAHIKGGYSPGGIHIALSDTFRGCTNLRRVMFGDGNGWASIQCGATAFEGCTKLERIDKFSFWVGGQTLDLSMAPKFQIDCIETCVAGNDSRKDLLNTLVLHPDVFAQCTEELMAKAATKYITITTP